MYLSIFPPCQGSNPGLAFARQVLYHFHSSSVLFIFNFFVKAVNMLLYFCLVHPRRDFSKIGDVSPTDSPALRKMVRTLPWLLAGRATVNGSCGACALQSRLTAGVSRH